jgi:flavin reductase (DIM6/NTAB) family NADH-FMN oxidoreductase RutF
MVKKSIGMNVFIYPMPVVLAGTQADNRANFMAVGWIARANLNPPMVAIGLHKSHFTSDLIKKNKTFSINLPSLDLIEKTDYCGLVSGVDTDKSKVFDIFYGKLDSAPMISECPLCFECKLFNTMDLPTHYLFVGEIIESYTDERYLTDGKLDVKKINPLLLTMPDNNYWTVGNQVGKAWSEGKKFRS